MIALLTIQNKETYCLIIIILPPPGLRIPMGIKGVCYHFTVG